MDLARGVVLLLDEAGHRRDVPERALQHAAVENPFLKLVAENIRVQEALDMAALYCAKPRDHQPVIGELEAEGLEPQMLHAPRDEHAERLVRLAPGEGVEQRVVAALAGMLDQQPVRARDGGEAGLQIEPARAPRPVAAAIRRAPRAARGRHRRGRSKAASARRNRPEPCGSPPGAGRASSTMSRMPAKASSSPAKKKVSPGVSPCAKYSSISPRMRPPGRGRRFVSP